MTACTFIVGDTRDVVADMATGSVDLVLTSPPFLGLRSYLPDDHPDKAREVGHEPNPGAFVDALLELVADWRRVLAPHGTIAVELGDCYSGTGGAGGDWSDSERTTLARVKGGSTGGPVRRKSLDGWPDPKCKAMVPEAFRLALAYGANPLSGEASPAGRWLVRNVVTWCRPNPPVGALADKYRPSTSDMVVACTSARRWFDMEPVRTPHTEPDRLFNQGDWKSELQPHREGAAIRQHPKGAPPLDHWVIPPGGFDGAHYAVFPPELLRIPVESCCPRRVCRSCGEPSRRVKPEGMNDTPWSTCGCDGADGLRHDGYHTGDGWRAGVVLDPFAGSGTTGVVAHGRSRDVVMVDLDRRNADLAMERLGMFIRVADP